MKPLHNFFLISCLGFLLLFLATPVQAAGVNIVPNPSLETASADDASLPADWVIGNYGNHIATFEYLTTGYTGNRSVKVNMTSYTDGDAWYKFNEQPVDGGAEYDFSVYYKTSAYPEIYAEMFLDNGEVAYEYLGYLFPSSSWNKFSVRFMMPSNVVTATIYIAAVGVGYVTTDDYSLAIAEPQIGFNRAMVTLTYDENAKSVYTYGYPLFKKYGVVGDIYLTTEQLGMTGFMTKYQLNQYRTLGFEMGSHTITHPHLTQVNNTKLTKELLNSRNKISTYFGGIAVPSFATPYGEYNAKVLTYIKKYYKSHRTTNVGFNSKENFDPYLIKAYSVESTTNINDIIGWINKAIQDKTWLVLVYHDIRPDDGSGFLWTTTPQDMETVLAYLKSHGVATLTTTQAVNEIQSQMQ